MIGDGNTILRLSYLLSIFTSQAPHLPESMSTTQLHPSQDLPQKKPLLHFQLFDQQHWITTKDWQAHILSITAVHILTKQCTFNNSSIFNTNLGLLTLPPFSANYSTSLVSDWTFRLVSPRWSMIKWSLTLHLHHLEITPNDPPDPDRHIQYPQDSGCAAQYYYRLHHPLDQTSSILHAIALKSHLQILVHFR